MPQRVFAETPPNADGLGIATGAGAGERVDILFVNPPAPDRGIWIRSQHRVGRRSREGMIWPQADLAQLAALFPDKRVAIIDAIPSRMTWAAFAEELKRLQPTFYLTQVTAPTLENDMYGAFLARSGGATTIAMGTHVTPMPLSTLEAYPALDYCLVGEPELTLRELVDALCPDEADHLRAVAPDTGAALEGLLVASDAGWRPVTQRGTSTEERLATIPGLAWRRNGQPALNAPRALIEDLDALPLPRHDLLPLARYRAPLVSGAYSFVVTSRGCPGDCRFCIKHVSYGRSVRFRSPENVLREIEMLAGLGIRSIHMYADLFTVNRDHVLGICQGLLDRGLKIRWTCNSRVDFVDPEMLDLMKRSGCWMISWGIESGDVEMLRRMHKGITLEGVRQALEWSRRAHIRNWGYFIIGLPGESERSIRHTIDFAKTLPLDLALFHIAAPHPGTPFFYEVVDQGWFRPGTRWERVDMDRSTVLDYPELSAEDLEAWARRALREWALRPGPVCTYGRMLATSPSLWRAALAIGLESLGWLRGAGSR
ncbi:MAG: radical SAM protein [Chloroflexi bacterium]|nr:radical SAM protein [Chloroflexota bacterium]